MSPEASSGSRAPPTKQVPPTGEFGRSGESMGKHSNTIGAITLGFVALGTSDTALFLKSKTVALVTPTCREDDGRTELRGAKKRIVNLGTSAIVPHTRVRFIRTIGTFFSAIVAKTITVVRIRDTLEAIELRPDGTTKAQVGARLLTTRGEPVVHPRIVRCAGPYGRISHKRRATSAQNHATALSRPVHQWNQDQCLVLKNGIGGQTRWVPDRILSDRQKNICVVFPTPSPGPSVQLDGLTSPVHKCVSSQSLAKQSSTFGSSKHTPATHVKNCQLEVVQQTLIGVTQGV